MDNTLFDFVEAKLKACKAVVECVGYTAEMELVDYFLADPIDVENLDCIYRYLQDRGLNDDETYKRCCEIYKNIKISNIENYVGVEETLKQVRALGYKTAVVTDAFENNAKERLTRSGLAQYFDVLVTADMTGTKKPEPNSILFALKQLDVKAKEAVFVGDSIRRDIECANKIGLITIYAAYGDRNFHENNICTADYTIKRFDGLLVILDKY